MACLSPVRMGKFLSLIHIYFLIDGAFYLVDLPGYGYAKVSQAEKARWGRLMEEWFADNSLMTLGLMIVDARHKPTADDCTMRCV